MSPLRFTEERHVDLLPGHPRSGGTILQAGLSYQSGFANEFATEALTGALPVGATRRSAVRTASMPSSSPGTAFTAPRGGEPPLVVSIESGRR